MTSQDAPRFASAILVERDVRFTLEELCRSCQAPEGEVRAWVLEGLLEPSGDRPENWSFEGAALRRARVALRLSRDLEVNLAGIALALELLDEIAALRSKLQGTPAEPETSASTQAE